MKIVSIVPGFGGTFYCGNCLRDSGYVKTLRSMGHDAILLPIYLPLTSNDQAKPEVPVFYGAVNIYLKQNYSIFRHLPGWAYRFLDSRPILKFAAKKAGSTRASGLEDMTISMLRGIDGFQKEELMQLVYFLKHHEKPDIVHLSNALLLGLAETIRKELNIPVICSLQDEDVWVDAMLPGFRGKIWQLMAEKAKYVDAFIAVSDFFADVMKKNMQIEDEKMHVVYIGVNPSNYEVFMPSLNPPVIGYLSRLCEDNGLEILVDAFIELKDNSSFKNARLRITGGYTGDDRRFINRLLRKLKRKGYLHDVEIVENFTPDSLPSFFKGLTVLSVPVLKGEAFGLYQLESLASGIPVVQPDLGAFPEIVTNTGGGTVYSPNTYLALAEALRELFTQPEKLQQMSLNGHAALMDTYNSETIALRMISVYDKVLHRS
jgi:glycosyltransferase involved in cell wall biosynthesis